MSWSSVPPSGGPPYLGGLGMQLTAKTLADRCWEHACSYNYVGPVTHGPMLCGWPIDELINVLEPNASRSERMNVLIELQSKFGSLLPSTPMPAPARPYTLEERLAMRMHWGRMEDSKWAPGFRHVAFHAWNDKVHIWIITTNGQSVVLEDEAPLFPSDALVTKLNTIKD